MSEINEIGQGFGRASAAVLSAALITARLAMQRRAERAEQARVAGERQQAEAARQLQAERAMAAVQWERVNLAGWFRSEPEAVAQVWASAATWAPFDERAAEAFDSLNTHLDRLGDHSAEVAQAMREAGDYEGLAVLLARGAAEAHGKAATQQQAGADRDGGELAQDLAVDAVTDRIVEVAAEGLTADQASDQTRVPVQGRAGETGAEIPGAPVPGIYGGGDEAVRLAGLCFTSTTAQVLARAAQQQQDSDPAAAAESVAQLSRSRRPVRDPSQESDLGR
jgi:hypothetical protein